ncbi:MAG TPA: prepilin-type N-terminal cleavage/methylation domain-containing protein [Candidatus Pacearchaeota archaeon]|nr:prepilin-type N-terminal cleavage/methylation domain-containing protein [Candidatus Pacearchaeota archaeon]
MNKRKSFTLIELLVVIVIIGILAGVIMISTSSSIDKANFAKAQTFSNTVQEELLLNLVSEWTFDEPEISGKTLDSWGNNDGSLGGTTLPLLIDNCVSGTCYNFNGAGFIDYGKPDNLNFDKGNFSVSFWIKALSQGETNGILGKRVGNWSAIYPGFEILISTSQISVIFADGVLNANGAAIQNVLNNEWHYVVYSFNRSSNLIGYLDGVQAPGAIRNISSFTESINNNYNFDIGRTQNHDSYNMTGSIDDVRIYNAALSTSEIKQNYIAGLNSMLSNGNISNKEYNERINELAYDK